VKYWLLLIACIFMITSLTTAALSLSSPAARVLINMTALSSIPKTTVDIDKILEIAALRKESLEQSGQWPPLLFIEQRQLKFNYSQNVNGVVSPVRFKGRDLGSYASIYKKINVDNAMAKERTSALDGDYKTEESLGSFSALGVAYGWIITPPLLAILDEYGLLNDEIATNRSHIFSNKNIVYSGKEINNLESYWNRNPTSVGTSSVGLPSVGLPKIRMPREEHYLNTDYLYNKKLIKESKSSLTQSNSIITDSIIYFDNAGIKTKADLNYSSNSQGSGITDINYGMVSFREPLIFNTKPGSMYTVINEAQDRYIGNYNIVKNIQMSTMYLNEFTDENWIPCCFEGWDTLQPIYQRKFGRDTKGIFDCRCHLGYAYGIDFPLTPSEAQFNNTAI
jgi:hypothetical protein